ncbi:MAG: Rho termination factor N-terminal domain-containing protein [Aeromicrobium sp.]|uniref:DUF7218 family protein n=1 Tax=Aeromicrobium sp. TaxID=1871063 RepID=UPI003C43F4A7
MPADRSADDNPSLKNPDMYESMREDGASKEKAARVSNATQQPGRSEESVGARGGRAGSYDDWTVDDLRGRAKELGLEGYSDLAKDQLIEELRRH